MSDALVSCAFALTAALRACVFESAAAAALQPPLRSKERERERWDAAGRAFDRVDRSLRYNRHREGERIPLRVRRTALMLLESVGHYVAAGDECFGRVGLQSIVGDRNIRRMQSPENTPPDPDALTKALDLELAQKRAQWERDRRRRGTWRALSILFLFVIVAAALFVWFYLIPTLNRNHRASPEPRPPGQTH